MYARRVGGILKGAGSSGLGIGESIIRAARGYMTESYVVWRLCSGMHTEWTPR